MKVITAGQDFKINLFSGPPFKLDQEAKEHKNYVNCLRYSSDGASFVSVSSDKTANIFDGVSAKKTSSLETDKEGGHSGSIYNCVWSPDNKLISNI
jgi:WD40 repeat protein